MRHSLKPSVMIAATLIVAVAAKLIGFPNAESILAALVIGGAVTAPFVNWDSQSAPQRTRTAAR